MHVLLEKIEVHVSDQMQVSLLKCVQVNFQVREAKEISPTRMQGLAGKQISGKLFWRLKNMQNSLEDKNKIDSV